MSDNLLNNEDLKTIEAVDYQKQAGEYLAGWQRARADYQNLKKETEAKIVQYVALANKELLVELLPLVDYFKNAFKHLPDNLKGNDWVDGVRHIQSKLEQVLAYAGVKEMEVVGEKFDPKLHESIGEVEQAGVEHGTIIEEVRTGFKLHDEILQPARVKIAK